MMNILNLLKKESNRIRKIYLYKLQYSKLQSVEKFKDIYIEKINYANYEMVKRLRDKATSESFKNMLDENQVGIYAMLDGEPIGHAWADLVKVKKVVNDSFIISPYAAMVHYCYVSDKYRGKGIYPYLLYTLINDIYVEHNISDFYITVDIDNIPSQKGVAKVGFRKINDITQLYLLGKVVNKTHI